MNTQHISWSLERRHIRDLKPAPYNPRQISSEEKAQLEQSLDGFGRVMPLVVNTGSRSNILIGGNQRWKIYHEQGLTEVEVMVPERELTLTEEQELNLRLNKNTGSWDLGLLKGMDFDLLREVGFDERELPNFFNEKEVVEDNYERHQSGAEDSDLREIREGDIWQLGPHRLLVGDPTKPCQLSQLFEDRQAHLIHLDLPSGRAFKKSRGQERSTLSQYRELLADVLEAAIGIASLDSHVFSWCDARDIGSLQALYHTHNITFKRLCV